MAQTQAAGWQLLLNGSGFEDLARLVLGPDTDRPFVLVPPHLYSKLTEAAEGDAPGHKRAPARTNRNEGNDAHDNDDRPCAYDLADQEVLQLLASSQGCTLEELRLIPDESTDSRQGGQWTAGARMWPGLVVFAVPSPLCHLADQRQVHLADQQQGHSQHMSLVILSNAPALGQSVKAATKHSQQTPEGLAMLIHLDPHSSQPYPNCKNRQWRCPQCQSCVFRGAEPAAVLLPILMMLQRVIRCEGEAFRQSSQGRRNKMQHFDFCLGTKPQDHMHLYSVPVPPMLPLCMTATTRLAAVPGQPSCQCVGSCLVLLHWLAAWPPNQHDLDSRAAAVWNRRHAPWTALPLSPAWYPPMYVDLLIRDLQALAEVVQQQVRQQQQQEENTSGRQQQQQQQQQRSPDLHALWKQVLQSRLRSGQICYPGPLGHLAMLKQLTVQQMQQLWLPAFSWSEGHMLGYVQHLQNTIRTNSHAHTALNNNGVSSSSAAAAASEAACDCESLVALMLPAITGDIRSLSIQVCNKLAAGCKQFSPVPWRVVASVCSSTAEKRLGQLTVVQARAQRYIAKPQAGHNASGRAAGQQTADCPQPGRQSIHQQDQSGEAGVGANRSQGDGAGGGSISDDSDQYLDWRVQSSGSEDDEAEPHWCHQPQQQQQQQRQCQQQQQIDLRGVVADENNLHVQDSPPPGSTAVQAPDQCWHQEQLPQQHPLLNLQHQEKQLAHEGQQAASAPASAAARNRQSLKQAAERLCQADTGSAAAAPKQSTGVAEQACQHHHLGKKGHKEGGSSCIQQRQRSRQRARQGAVPTASHKRQRDAGDTGKSGHCDGLAAGAELSPSYHHQHQPMTLETAPALLPQPLVPKTARKHQQQRKQWQEHGTSSQHTAAHSSPAGPMQSLGNSPYCSQKTTTTAAAARHLAGTTAAGAKGAAARGAPSMHPIGSLAMLAMTKRTEPGSGAMTGEQTRELAATQRSTPSSQVTAQRTQTKAMVKLMAKLTTPRGNCMDGWKQ